MKFNVKKNLKPTQKAVLGVLIKFKDGIHIDKLFIECKKVGVASNHVESALKFFLDNDYIYQISYEGFVSISPDGMNEYYSN